VNLRPRREKPGECVAIVLRAFYPSESAWHAAVAEFRTILEQYGTVREDRDAALTRLYLVA
jgi:outer membrane protein assembly factor BamD (BamD/ComL family)